MALSTKRKLTWMLDQQVSYVSQSRASHSPLSPIDTPSKHQVSSTLLTLTEHPFTCACVRETLLHESALAFHLCLLQQNVPSWICPNKTPSDTTDFPGEDKQTNKILHFHLNRPLKIRITPIEHSTKDGFSKDVFPR